MKRRKATETEIRALSAKLDNPKDKVACPTCGGEIAYMENTHGRAAICERCSIMAAERGL